MKVLVRDQNGNTLGTSAADVESSRVEGLSIGLSDDSETIIVTVDVEES